MATNFYVVPSQLTSLLSVVNLLLASLGESPVTTLDPSPSSDVDSALMAIDMIDLLVQGGHFIFNQEPNVPTALDINGKVPLPDQTLMVTAAYYSPNQFLNVIQRGQFLYDLEHHTFVFQKPPAVDIKVRLSWDELPSQARLYIAYMACKQFHAQQQERQILLSVTSEALQMALVALEQYEDQIGKFSSVYGNISVVTALEGNGGLRRNRDGA